MRNYVDFSIAFVDVLAWSNPDKTSLNGNPIFIFTDHNDELVSERIQDYIDFQNSIGGFFYEIQTVDIFTWYMLLSEDTVVRLVGFLLNGTQTTVFGHIDPSAQSDYEGFFSDVSPRDDK